MGVRYDVREERRIASYRLDQRGRLPQGRMRYRGSQVAGPWAPPLLSPGRLSCQPLPPSCPSARDKYALETRVKQLSGMSSGSLDVACTSPDLGMRGSSSSGAFIGRESTAAAIGHPAF